MAALCTRFLASAISTALIGLGHQGSVSLQAVHHIPFFDVVWPFQGAGHDVGPDPGPCESSTRNPVRPLGHVREIVLYIACASARFSTQFRREDPSGTDHGKPAIGSQRLDCPRMYRGAGPVADQYREACRYPLLNLRVVQDIADLRQSSTYRILVSRYGCVVTGP